MRASLFHRLVLPALVLAAGCPKGPATTTSKVSDAPDPQMTKLARVLRTADRLIVDGSSETDLERLETDAEASVRAAAAEALGRLHDPHGTEVVKRLLEDAD